MVRCVWKTRENATIASFPAYTPSLERFDTEGRREGWREGWREREREGGRGWKKEGGRRWKREGGREEMEEGGREGGGGRGREGGRRWKREGGGGRRVKKRRKERERAKEMKHEWRRRKGTHLKILTTADKGQAWLVTPERAYRALELGGGEGREGG